MRAARQAVERAEQTAGLVHDWVVVGVAAAEGAAVGRRRRRGVARESIARVRSGSARAEEARARGRRWREKKREGCRYRMNDHICREFCRNNRVKF